MKLALKMIYGVGDLERERIVLTALDNCDIGTSAIFVARRGTTSQTVEGGSIPHCFWWPDKRVKEGDLIVLYTKTGAPSVKENPSGLTSHFFYWDLNEPVWKPDKVAVLVEIGRQWAQLAVDEEEAMEVPSEESNG
ncbi:MAG TPA: hypothetical protein VII34_01875 [Pyrinomonadaceae bacterium]